MTDRDFFRAHGICTQCRKEKAMPGKAYCWECAEKDHERKVARYAALTDEQREAEIAEWKARTKELRRRRIESGTCVQCGKRPAWNGRQRCLDCTLKARRRARSQPSRAKYTPEELYQFRVASAAHMREIAGVSEKSRRSIDGIWRMMKSGC